MSNQPSNSRLKAGCFSAVDVWISDGWSPSFCYQKVAVIGSRLKAGFQTFISDIFQPSKNPFWPPDFLIKIRLRQTSQLKNSSQIDASGSIQCALDRREPAEPAGWTPAEPAGWPPAEPAGWSPADPAGWSPVEPAGFQTAANDGYFLVTKRRRSAVWNSDVYGWLHMYVVYAYNSRQWVLYPHYQIGIYIFLEIPSKLSKPWYFIYGFKEGIVCMKIILWEINSNDILTSNIFINRITISS